MVRKAISGRTDKGSLVDISVEEQKKEIDKARLQCHKGIADEVTSTGNYCKAAWDGLMCWPATQAGETAELQCAWYVNQFFLHAKATRQCMDNGEWFIHSEINTTWTNYTSCRHVDASTPDVPLVPEEHIERIKLMYSIGYGVSLFALAVAIFIMIYFRRLHCPRNIIHLNLFTAFVLRALLSFLKDSLLIAHLGLPGDVLEDSRGNIIFDPEGTHWQCKLLFTTFHYVQLASSAWVFMEGLYLYILVTVTIFSERRYIRWCTILGWGGPLFFLVPWIIMRATTEDVLCWNTHPTQALFWILKGPQVAIAVVNFIFFLNIIRVLFTKLVRSAPPKARKFRYRRLGKSTLVLIPMFGVHYLVTIGVPEKTNPVMETIKLYFEMFFNSFQGLLIACLFCFMNGEVQTEIRKRYIRHKLRVNSRNYQNKEPNSSSGSENNSCMNRQKLKIYIHQTRCYRSPIEVSVPNDVRPIIYMSKRNSFV
ncbi:unnamed protein product [Candidula unifasciata]|uniref:Uncharacterized protein n=1 Tax=Candidula unifasciata TaxID=100452 RepID=A0A8S3YU12_9EUPU|nr:unnamed protein product [Candidula unifasciata]